MTATRMRSIDRLAEFASALRFNDIPDVAVSWARRGVVDTLGVIAAAAGSESLGPILRYATSSAPGATRLVHGQGARASVEAATMIAGTMAHALDYDDVGLTTWGHPSAPLTGVILGLADHAPVSPAAAIVAYVAGFEVAAAVGAVCAADQFRRGWHASATLGALSSAVTASLLLGLDEQRLANALALAASMPVGLQANFGTMAKSLHIGLAARNGVTAALLAEQGISASSGALDGSQGFVAVLGSPDATVSLESLGTEFDLANGLCFKYYPSCAATHRVIDGVLDLVSDHDIDPVSVTAIQCDVSARSLIPLVHPKPRTATQARFSLPFAAAIAVLDRAAGLRQYADERVAAADVGALLDRVDVRIDPDQGDDVTLETEYATVSIQRSGHEAVSTVVHIPRGFPQHPLTDDQLVGKVRDCCAAAALPREAADVLASMLTRPDELGSTSDLLTVLAQP